MAGEQFDYEMPAHLGWRVLLALTIAGVSGFVAVRFFWDLLPLPLVLIGQVLFCAWTGWFAGKWAFRSPLTFRRSVGIILREYRRL